MIALRSSIAARRVSTCSWWVQLGFAVAGFVIVSVQASRELFPLPCENAVHRFGEVINSNCSLNRTTKRRISRKQHGAEWCDAGIRTLNELSGLPFSESPNAPRSLAQHTRFTACF